MAAGAQLPEADPNHKEHNDMLPVKVAEFVLDAAGPDDHDPEAPHEVGDVCNDHKGHHASLRSRRTATVPAVTFLSGLQSVC